MGTKQEIPEYVGSTLTNGAFLNYASAVLGAYVDIGFDELALTDVGTRLIEAVEELKKAVNRQSAYDETPAVTRADGNRDALAKSLWYAWNYLRGLHSSHPFAAHCETLRSEMAAYKGVWHHELRKETSELDGLKTALSTSANRTALIALGLDKLAAALWDANDAAREAMKARYTERGERDAEKAAGTTPELRKAVANLLVRAGKTVNAVATIDPENEKAAQAITKVRGIIDDFKLVASEAKHRSGGDEPAPEPEPEPEA